MVAATATMLMSGQKSRRTNGERRRMFEQDKQGQISNDYAAPSTHKLQWQTKYINLGPTAHATHAQLPRMRVPTRGDLTTPNTV